MKQVLFSCVGTTDPIRGCHDGAMLHIMRYYRPEKVCIFMTPEISAIDEREKRYDRVWAHVRENWDGYAPEMQKLHAAVKDASDMDEVDVVLTKAFTQFCTENDGAEVLVNITSGTPQMQMILSQLVLDLRYNAVGVQVKNYEKRAGTSDRTNSKKYDFDFELEFFEEEESGEKAVNRCVVPRMYAIRREQSRQQLTALLNQRDYDAVLKMKNVLTDKQRKLVEHLALRNNLQHAQAFSAAKDIKLPFELYPVKRESSADIAEYREVSEYFLMMQNLQYTQRYTDFVLRMNPFIVQLQGTLVDQLLRKAYRVRLTELMEYSSGRRKISEEKMAEKVPELLEGLNRQLMRESGRSFVDSDPSIYVYQLMLKLLPNVPEICGRLFDCCNSLNKKRNVAAHQLRCITDDMICNESGMSCAEMVQQMQKAIMEIYPECEPKLFNVYQKCGDYILNER